ncbi:MAG: DUF255 domain-containing protein [Planctomycetota bacterium]|nr:DUF255 domain-containing protein [Planctomycetota bacterium]
MRWLAIIVVILFLPLRAQSASTSPQIKWQDWSNDVFQKAKQQHKFVLLDLGTQWCHWCHVMDDQTYANDQVIALINASYVPVRVDADARLDLAGRYEDYGWPATIVFNPSGGEIVKRRGYLAPNEMISMLRAIIADPTPGPSVVAPGSVEFTRQPSLDPKVLAELLRRHADTFDDAQGGWGRGQKFLDANSVEWSLRQAPIDEKAARMARLTLDGELNLIDPAWGGVYQYSTDNDWKHPHFEKIMQMQSQDLRTYALAYAEWHEPRYLTAAQSIHKFLVEFLLSPDGAFYTSQDADLIDGVHSTDYFKLDAAHRRAQGIPHIDKHIYSRENGWAIAALVSCYEATSDQKALREAITAATWIDAHRNLSGGGFSHDQKDLAGPFLGDSLAMGQAFLELYTATADRAWLKRAQDASDFLAAHFVSAASPGVMTSDAHSDGPLAPTQELDENVGVARWANLLFQYTGRQVDRALAETAMKYLATPDVALSRNAQVAGLLLANSELAAPALHIAVVGSKTSPVAQSLFVAAIAAATGYKRVEWIDFSEPALPNGNVEYPHFARPAAFVCNAATCSTPAYSSEELARKISRALAAAR